MPTITRSQACSVQPTEQVASPRDGQGMVPRRVLRSGQGNAGVIMNIGEGSTSFIVAQWQASEYSITKCRDKRCRTCPNFNTSKTV